MASKVFHTKKDISKHLSAHQKSKLSVPVYCKKHNIPPSTFYHWQKANDTKRIESKLPDNSFARLTLTSSNPIYYEIVKNDFTIRVPSAFDSSVLRRIVEVLS